MSLRNQKLVAAATLTVPRSPLRIMHLLETLALAPNGLSLAKLSQRLSAPKTSVLNLLRALNASNYVISTDGLYRLGTAALRLGAAITGGSPFLRSVRTQLLELAEASGETALFGVFTEDRHHAMYIDIVESRSAIRFSAILGTRLPLYCTALGRALLSFQSEAFIDAYFDREVMQQHTPKTLIDKNQVLETFDELRRSGVGFTSEEMLEGVAGIGSPIFDRGKHVRAAVLIAAPVDRALTRRAELSDLVRATGAEISRLCGYTGIYPPSAAQR